MTANTPETSDDAADEEEGEPDWTIRATIELDIEALLPHPTKPSTDHALTAIERGDYTERTVDVSSVSIDAIERAAPSPDADSDRAAETEADSDSETTTTGDAEPPTEPQETELEVGSQSTTETETAAEGETQAETDTESEETDDPTAERDTADVTEQEADQSAADEPLPIEYVSESGETLQTTTDPDTTPKRGESVSINNAYYVVYEVTRVEDTAPDEDPHIRVTVS